MEDIGRYLGACASLQCFSLFQKPIAPLIGKGEKGFSIRELAGDLAGSMAFAVLMGSSRAFYGKFGDRINMDKFMVGMVSSGIGDDLRNSILVSTVFPVLLANNRKK